jgi:hypothetical protein
VAKYTGGGLEAASGSWEALIHITLCLCTSFCFSLWFEILWGAGIATGYGLDGPGIESWWGRGFSHTSRPALGPTKVPRSRECRAIPLPPLLGFRVCYGVPLPLPYEIL